MKLVFSLNTLPMLPMNLSMDSRSLFIMPLTTVSLMDICRAFVIHTSPFFSSEIATFTPISATVFSSRL